MSVDIVTVTHGAQISYEIRLSTSLRQNTNDVKIIDYLSSHLLFETTQPKSVSEVF